MLIETERLFLVSTPPSVFLTRLEADDFRAELAGRRVHFPPEWPGEVYLTMLRSGETALRDLTRQGSAGNTWDGTLVLKADLTAAGQMGFKGGPDVRGTAEIGYGLNASVRGRGYATEMVRGMTAWGRAQSGVKRLIAKTAPDNLASARVLEKAGFVQVGRVTDGQDGELLLWEQNL